MLCKYYWIVLYTVHVTAFCLGGGAFFPDTVYMHCLMFTFWKTNDDHPRSWIRSRIRYSMKQKWVKVSVRVSRMHPQWKARAQDVSKCFPIRFKYIFEHILRYNDKNLVKNHFKVLKSDLVFATVSKRKRRSVTESPRISKSRVRNTCIYYTGVSILNSGDGWQTGTRTPPESLRLW